MQTRNIENVDEKWRHKTKYERRKEVKNNTRAKATSKHNSKSKVVSKTEEREQANQAIPLLIPSTTECTGTHFGNTGRGPPRCSL